MSNIIGMYQYIIYDVRTADYAKISTFSEK